MKQRVDILKGPIIPVILELCLPILICGFVQQGYNLIDLYIVGKYVNETSVAIIGGSSSLLSSIATNVIGGFVSGSIVVIGNKLGQKREDQISASLFTSYRLMAILTLIFIGLYLLFGQMILELLKVPQDILADSVRYLKFYACGFFFYGLFQLSVNCLRTAGETLKPTLLLIDSFLINIGMDCLFIIFLKMGYEGVCAAYFVSQMISSFLAIRQVKKAYPQHSDARFDRAIGWDIVRIAIPSAATSLAFSLTSTYVQSFFNRLDTLWISAYAIYAKLERLFWTVMNGLQFALCTFVAQNYGAQDSLRIRKGLRAGLLVFALAAVLCSSIVIVFGPFYARGFITSPQTLDSLKKITWVVAPYYVIYSVMELFTALFKGSKRPLIPLLINIICICLLRVIWLRIFTETTLSYKTVCLCWPVSWILASVAYLICYFVFYKTKTEGIQVKA